MRIRIEMEVPGDVDTSDILQECQAMALEFFENSVDDYLDNDFLDMIDNAVSVEVVDHADAFVPKWTNFE